MITGGMMEKIELKPIIESLVFVSEEPMSLDLMAMVFEEVGVKKAEIKEVLEELKNDCNANPDRGLHIIEVAGGYQFRTKPECAEWIQKLNVPKAVRLSQPAMETLAIIAYRQPVLRSEIESIRGVDSGGVLKTLLERGLVRIIGKGDDVGHPLIYGTTQAFLEMFSLNSLKDLPTLKEIESLDVQEKVGDLGRVEIGEGSGSVGEGVGEVIAEYKDGVEAYKPDPGKVAEDGRAIRNLESSIKRLRKLEKDIFPKPVEQITAVPKEFDETASAQDTGEVDEALTEES